MSSARLKIGAGRISMLMMIPMLAMQAPALADCQFDWRLEQTVPDIETAVQAIVTWDPDGAGPQQPLLAVGGRTRLNPGIDPAEYSGGVATWDGTTWQLLGTAMNGQVMALAVHEGSLIAGGEFSVAGGNTVNCLARWTGANWELVGGGVGANFSASVSALMSNGSSLLVGGGFTTAGGQPISRSIAMWDGQDWESISPGLSAAVRAMTIYEGELVVGGGFEKTQGTGSISVNHVARRVGNAWQQMPIGQNNGMTISQGNATVFALTVYDGKLIAGGRFTTAGGLEANYIAQWDGATWAPLGSGMAGDDPTAVNALAVYDGKLIAGGRFTSAGGQSANFIAQWDGANWQPLGAGFNGRAVALALNAGELVAGGFLGSEDDGSSRVARWGPACELRGDMDCSGQVDQADTPLFVTALLNASSVSTCDAWLANMNADIAIDGTPRIDGSDVAPFVQALLSP